MRLVGSPPYYLDWNATAPLRAEAFAAMQEALGAGWGNPSSRHRYGEMARRALEGARKTVADCFDVAPSQVIFTSGGSEANNAWIKGVALAQRQPGVIAVSAIEHPCVYEPARQLQRLGWRLIEIAVDGQGRIDPHAWTHALAQRPTFVSVMLANNETGVLQDVAALAREAKAVGAFVHCDAVQALGKIPVSWEALGVDALTFSGHKIGAPVGVGVLIVDRRVDFWPLVAGGGQEHGLRSGTENVAAISAFAAVLPLALIEQPEFAAHTRTLQARLEAGLRARGAVVFGEGAERLPNTTFFAFSGEAGESWVLQLDRAGFAVASGSACSSTKAGPARTLVAMGVEETTARAAVRISTGASTPSEAIDELLAAIDAMRIRVREDAVVTF